MPTWQDIEDVMAYWYREGGRIDWMDLAEIRQDQEDLSATWQHVTARLHLSIERTILAEKQEDLDVLLAYIADELRPQLRLAAADLRASNSLGS